MDVGVEGPKNPQRYDIPGLEPQAGTPSADRRTVLAFRRLSKLPVPHSRASV
jgi:hypothetical protein